MSYIIKKLEDHESGLAKQLIAQWHIDDNEEVPSLHTHYIDNLLDSNHFHAFIAMDGETVVGGLTAYQLPMFYRSESEIFLYEIGVLQQHRKKGVAKALIEQLKQYCKDNSIKVMFVMTTMDNEPAKKLYENTGGELEVVPLYSYSI